MTIEELALAYELRQSGLCWKLVARELGGDHRRISAQVLRLCAVGFERDRQGNLVTRRKHGDFSFDQLRHAGKMHAAGYTWALIADGLGVDRDKLRKAWRYAVGSGLIKPPRRSRRVVIVSC